MSNKSTRSINSTKNIITGIGGQIINIILGFAARTFFIQALGKEYLGVSGLFTNILTILNISELGISAAIVFSLYKPLTLGDREKVAASLRLLKRIYTIIGFVVLALGLMLMPFLRFIIKGDTEVVNIYAVYIIYLMQSVLSYWFYSYKYCVLQADQKQYVVSLVGYIITVSTHVLQIAVLLLIMKTGLLSPSSGFLIYLSVNMVFVIVKNILVSNKVDKMYPYLSNKALKEHKYELEKEEKRGILKNVVGLACYKISGTVLNSTDNIIITHYISLATVGIYSNYLMILTIITTLIGVIFGAFTAGVGNLYVTESKEKSEFIFRCLNLLNFWVYGVCGICFFYLVNPFIKLWVGEDYLFPMIVIVVIVFNFLSDGLQNAVILYKDACGLFWEGKYRPIASALLNIVLSLILVKFIDISGVILGTVLSRLLTTWWFDARLVHRRAFEKSPAGYFFRYIRSMLIITSTACVMYPLVNLIIADNLILWILRGCVCFLLPNLIFYVLFRRSEEFRYISGIGKDLIVHFIRR